jgi:hypothetical protein
MRAKTRLHGWLTLAGLAIALGGCGSSTVSRSEARDRATSETCNRFAACDQIGPGKAHETRESCEIAQRANWDTNWPAAECDGKINQSQLEICLTAIHSTECTNFFDILNTLGNKCPKAKICASGSMPDSGT